nr:MAG TPA: Protein of unknown function (DUF1642) [Caudoviricetes sp.]
MNKKELIKHIEDLPYNEGLIVDTIKISRNGLLKLIERLDEPEKITIPQFVADWIEKCKNSLIFSLKSAMNINTIMHYSEDYHKLIDWIKVNSNQETFCHAWIFGYEIEKEKRYTVVMKETKQPLYYNAGDKKLFFSLGGLATKFTRKQLEAAGFGWVFDCDGVEVEEVDD